VFSLLPSYGWENDGWQDSNVTGIQVNLVLSKMMPVWSRYFKQFESYSIFKCWSSKIQDGGRRPKWRNVSTSLGRSISVFKMCFVPEGLFAAFVVSSQYILLRRHTSVDSITQIRHKICYSVHKMTRQTCTKAEILLFCNVFHVFHHGNRNWK
jgi:hypothetical protein